MVGERSNYVEGMATYGVRGLLWVEEEDAQQQEAQANTPEQSVNAIDPVRYQEFLEREFDEDPRLALSASNSKRRRM